MPKKRAKKLTNKGKNCGKKGKNYTKKQEEQRASLITPLPKAPDAVNTIPPSPKRRRAAIVAEGKITSSAKPPPGFCPISDECKRAAIACCYFYQFDGAPQEEWTGSDGTIVGICNELPFGGTNSYGSVRNVLINVKEAMDGGWEYSPAMKRGTGGSNVLIPTGSYYSQLVADHMEDGLGLRTTRDLLNEVRTDEGLPHFVKQVSRGNGMKLMKHNRYGLHSVPCAVISSSVGPAIGG